MENFTPQPHDSSHPGGIDPPAGARLDLSTCSEPEWQEHLRRRINLMWFALLNTGMEDGEIVDMGVRCEEKLRALIRSRQMTTEEMETP